MTLREALLDSKKTGKTYMSVEHSGGFVSWDDETMYKFSAEQLVADDWESVQTGIPKLTNGRWGAVDE